MFKKPAPASGVLADRIRRVVSEASPPPRFAQTEPVNTSPIQQERARAPRQAVYRQGALVLGGGEKLSVALRNLSASGARVEFHVHVPLPAVVLLVEPTLKLRRRARVVWQVEGAAGLKFLDP